MLIHDINLQLAQNLPQNTFCLVWNCQQVVNLLKTRKNIFLEHNTSNTNADYFTDNIWQFGRELYSRELYTRCIVRGYRLRKYYRFLFWGCHPRLTCASAMYPSALAALNRQTNYRHIIHTIHDTHSSITIM